MSATNADEFPPQMERLVSIKKFIILLSSISGFQCTEPDWKFNIFSLITSILMTTTLLLLFYSMIRSMSDIFQLLETICCFGVVAPSVVKLLIVVSAPAKIRALWDFAVMVNLRNTEGHRSVILYESGRRTSNLIKTFACLFFCAGLLFGLFPAYNLLINGKPTLLLGIFIPFVNHQHPMGFAATMLYQMVISAYGITGNMAFDMFVAMIVSNYQGVVSIWECQLKELIEINRRSDTPKNRAYRRAFLRNLYVQLLDATEYVKNLDTSYGPVIGMQVVASASSIVLALFSIVANDWAGGYGFVIFSFCTIFMFSYIGTIVTNQNERLSSMIYELPWYEFDRNDKKVIQYMLLLSQNSGEMWIGPFAPLNVETAANIVQNVFSYYTMMIKFLED